MCNLPKVVLRLDNKKVSIEFSLFRNINVLTDKSGKGKSNMVSKLEEDIMTKREVELYGFYRGSRVKYKLNIVTMDAHVSDKDDFVLYICDDLDELFYDTRLAELYRKADKAVFLFISRGPSEGYYSRFVASADAVYGLNHNEDGGKEYFSFSRLLDEFSESSFPTSVGAFKKCVIEGSKGSSEWRLYDDLFSKVVCSDGRYNVCKSISKALSTSKDKDNLYVMVDLCGFGDCLEELIFECKKYDGDIEIANIDSFEVMMLESLFPELYEQVCSNRKDYVNGITYESYASGVLFSHRYGLCNKFSKSDILDCLKDDCDVFCDVHKRSKCRYYGTVKGTIIKMCENSVEFRIIVISSNIGGYKYAESVNRLS